MEHFFLIIKGSLELRKEPYASYIEHKLTLFYFLAQQYCSVPYIDQSSTEVSLSLYDTLCIRHCHFEE